MQLEDYFTFLAPDDIRIQGTRVGIETILYDFIHRKRTPEAIAQSYRTVTLENVYATILYYLHNQAAVDAYLADWLEWSHQMEIEQYRNPSPLVRKLMQLKTTRAAMREANDAPVSAR